MDKEVEIIVREDGIYEIKLALSKDEIKNLLKDRGHGYDREYLAKKMSDALCDRYVQENYTELCKLIDMNLVKLLATRRLAGVVASGD